jgi:glycogen phosphorylase
VDSISHTNTDAKVVAYLSAEFLTGPHLGNSLVNLGIWDAVEQALSKVGQNLSSVLEQEEEPGLGQWWPRPGWQVELTESQCLFGSIGCGR